MLQFSTTQQAILDLQHGHHACLAPAGSGKTAVLTERIVHALQWGIDAKDILCLTFTHRAGLNMQEKVMQRLNDAPQGLFIGNLHAYAFQHMHKHYQKKHLSLMDAGLQSQLLEQAMQQLHYVLGQPIAYVQEEWINCYRQYDLNLDGLLNLNAAKITQAQQVIFSANRYQAWQLDQLRQLILPLLSQANRLLKPHQKQYIRQRVRCLDQNIAAEDLTYAFACSVYLHSQYQELKHYYQVYDYDDLILDCLIQQAHQPQHHYQWLQIDEVQDLSPLHWLLIEYLQAPQAHLVVFGDIHQSIYRFLGASIELTQSHLGTNLHYLQDNFRNPANLVALANDYSQLHFPKAWVRAACATKVKNDQALLHLHRKDEQQQLKALLDLIQNSAEKQKSSAILLTTNAQADDFARYLQQHQIQHFCVTQTDLLARDLFLDVLAVLGSLYDADDQATWARLLWRFGQTEQFKPRHLSHLNGQCAALKLQHDLIHYGFRVADFSQVPTGFSNRLDYLLDLYDGSKLLYMDTETTGLSLLQDDIIQIAAVNQQQEIDLYCLTKQDISQSQMIHQISADILAARGQPLAEQIEKWIQFSQAHVLVAHNLKFDEAIMLENLRRAAPAYLPHFVAQTKFCSLQLTQQLFPHLSSYKLADLLAYFQLEGVNSHNALDDVKAGFNLLTHLCEQIRLNQAQVANLYQRSQACLMEFNQKFSPLYQSLKQQLQLNPQFKITDFLETYLGYIQVHLPELYKQYSLSEQQQLISKLSRHAELHFDHHDHIQYWQKLLSFYRTAKESDLITPADYVIVSTMHRAKGLEFDQVILPSLTDRHMPSYPVIKKMQSHQAHHRAEGQALLQEQQRLLYVALTRAKHSLVIGTYRHKTSEQKYAKPPVHHITPFLDELQDYFIAI